MVIIKCKGCKRIVQVPTDWETDATCENCGDYFEEISIMKSESTQALFTQTATRELIDKRVKEQVDKQMKLVNEQTQPSPKEGYSKTPSGQTLVTIKTKELARIIEESTKERLGELREECDNKESPISTKQKKSWVECNFFKIIWLGALALFIIIYWFF